MKFNGVKKFSDRNPFQCRTCKYHFPQQHQIHNCGKNKPNLRKKFGYVPQRKFLHEMTLEDLVIQGREMGLGISVILDPKKKRRSNK